MTSDILLIQRQRRDPERSRVLDTTVQTVPTSTLPLSMRGYDTSYTCPYCTLDKSQWYIFAVKRDGAMGLTNGVSPGFKCNRCKEQFLRQYLRPNWVIEDERSVPQNQEWQQYCIVPLPKAPLE